MGYALWLAPSSVEYAALTDFMKFRPKPHILSSRSRSYPPFNPHITLATFDALPPSFNVDEIPIANVSPPEAYFDSVKSGNTYLGALSIGISKSSGLMRLYESVTSHLNTLNIPWKSRGFPHLSLFYVDEPDERKRLDSQLKSSGRIQAYQGGRRLMLTADPNSSRSMRIKQFTATEIWLVDCSSRSVKQWRVLKKRSLISPALPPTPAPQRQTSGRTIHRLTTKPKIHSGQSYYLPRPPSPSGSPRRRPAAPNWRNICEGCVVM